MRSSRSSRPRRWRSRGEALDRALAAMGELRRLDLALSRRPLGRCRRARRRGRARAAGSTRRVRRRSCGPAFVHDLGRVAVHARIWQKPGPLTADEWEQVRLHPYHTERVLSRSPFLSALAPVAAAHHERLDGSGYHRGAAGADLTRSGAAARRRRRLPRDERAAAAPRAARARAGGAGSRRGGERRPARPRRGHGGARGGRAAGAAPRAPGGADRARGRGGRRCSPAACRPSRSRGRSGSR